MILLRRRSVITAAATLTAAYGLCKPRATLAGPAVRLDRLAPAGAAVPEISFATADGTVQTLADYAGKGIVLNFWATWCVPCVEEMPTLAKLSLLLRDSNVRVLPLSSDHGGAPVVQRFFDKQEITGLPILLDKRGDAARAFGARGLPTTVLIDAKGGERGRFEGAADWASSEAVAAVKALAAG